MTDGVARASMSIMRIDRGYLFWGIFFVLLGLIPLADREGWLQVGGLGDAGRLWPLIIIGIGLVIVFSRTRLALVATTIAALVLGTLAGTALAFWGGGGLDCRLTDGPARQRTTTAGVLDADPSVRIHLVCGGVVLRTAPGDGWALDAGHVGDPPKVEEAPGELSVSSADGPPRRQDWDLRLPSDLGTLDVEATAASATLDLTGATLTHLAASVNAGSLDVAGPAGPIDTLELDANAADLDVSAPATDIALLTVRGNATSVALTLGGAVSGTVEGNVMSIRVCVPDTAALAIETGSELGFSHDLASSGLTLVGDAWVRDGPGPRITLRVGGTASSLKLDQMGACS